MAKRVKSGVKVVDIENDYVVLIDTKSKSTPKNYILRTKDNYEKNKDVQKKSGLIRLTPREKELEHLFAHFDVHPPKSKLDTTPTEKENPHTEKTSTKKKKENEPGESA